MKRTLLFLFCFLVLTTFPSLSSGKELPKIAVWDLEPRNTPVAHARELTSFVVSEITKMKKYEVYSQENVRTLAGWSAERMKLGCTDTRCLLALGQMDITKLISGSVGKIGNRYTVSLNLFDTQNARAENAISKTCKSEDELIEMVQQTIQELLGMELATKNEKAGEVFLAENRTKEGVKTHVSGLQYKVIKTGTGKKPQLTDTVTVHYRGFLIDGTEFDSSYRRGRPAIFPVGGVISGWEIALQLMEEGAKWRLFIPPSLAYGERGAGKDIGPNATLIFDVELISIQEKK